MKKRLLAMTLAALLVLALVPTAGAAAYTVTEVVPCKYDDIGGFYEGIARVQVGFGKDDGFETYGFVDMTGREVVPVGKYGYVAERFSEGLAAVSMGGKDGFIDKTGKEVIPGKYDNARNFSGGFAPVARGTGAVDEWDDPILKWGFIDKTGKEVVPFQYDDVGDFSEGLAAVRVGDYDTGKWGFVDTTGREVVPCKYDDVGAFFGGLALVCVDGPDGDSKWGVIDKAGKEVIPCKYDHVRLSFSEGLAMVCVGDYYSDGKWGFIDMTGKEVVPVGQYSYVAVSFSEGLVAVEVNGKMGFVDKTGKEIIPCRYDYVSDFSEGLAAVGLDGKWGFIDKTGREVVSCKYDYVKDFSDGLAIVYLGRAGDYGNPYGNGKYGFIDKTGKEVVPCKYDYVKDFSDGLSAVKLDGKWGFVDKTGHEVVPVGKYANVAEYFNQGLAAVALSTGEEDEWGDPVLKWGFIDRTGREVIPCTLNYRTVDVVSNGMVRVRNENGQWGVLSVSAANIAYASTQTVELDGKTVTFECYALKDENGNMTNYIKLRDLAMLLNGSAAQFQVGWDGSVTITTGQAYTPNGSEQQTPFSGDRAYQEAANPTKVNGGAANLAAFILNDDKGGGYTYYQLRDLGKALGFNVGWANGRGIFLETNKPYDPNN